MYVGSISLGKSFPVKIFCQSCKRVFYIGTLTPFLTEKLYDFEALAFRHAWDNPEHDVLVDSVGIPFSFSLVVQTKKEELISIGDPRANKRYDENWNKNMDSCFCSICEKSYDNLEDACNCHIEAKILQFEE